MFLTYKWVFLSWPEVLVFVPQVLINNIYYILMTFSYLNTATCTVSVTTSQAFTLNNFSDLQSLLWIAETIEALPNNVHSLTQQREPTVAAAKRRQLNGTLVCRYVQSTAQAWTDRLTDRRGVTRKRPPKGGQLINDDDALQLSRR